MAHKITGFLGFMAVFSLLFSGLTVGDKKPVSAPSCSEVIPKVTFCLPYISGASPSPTDACCTGIKTVASLVKAKDDAVLVCNCLKDKLVDLQYEPGLIANLPEKCSVNIKLPAISKDTDCSKAEPPYYMSEPIGY
ncbi:hypothetical protein RND81_03G220600 [Saponaria officinalis]|uniref:Non-specific lipid-transfer protein n=1 Tax=Saponaria officinalis TaxID=3572 RepID=A0AAW1MB57_SAPOF